ncbi:ABC transporter permease [Streptomyces olivoreticuli]|uniref:ABC transporter permease n=1 Tax=Streptomyces blastmyceticus TaxID=68180 RepID=A0ABP3HQP7_9ACTN|nr:ABC transporter permease [Streptomyces olivoreticuli]WKK26036.1 ABC transporter permease [Streptomyces olivoreticuli]
MSLYLLRRALGAVLVLLVISVVIYATFYVAPGDPAKLACGPRCNPEQLRQVREQLSLDDPVYLQYWHFLQGIFAGHDYSTGTGVMHCDAPCFGLSYQNDQQVTELIAQRLPATVSLAAGAMVLTLLLGIGTGLLSVVRRGGVIERALTWLTLAGIATPVFISGLALLMIFCAYLEWLPFPSYVALTDDPEQWAWNMLLPWVALALLESSKYARMTRSSMLETLAEDHVRTFRAYGVSERAIVGKHALRGAVAPVIAMAAVDFGAMVGGTTLTETMFGLPGVGQLLVRSVQTVDLPVVVAIVMVIGAAVVVANIIGDVLHAAADRRVALR